MTLIELTYEIRADEPNGVMNCADCKDEIGIGDLFVRAQKDARINDTASPVCAECFRARLVRKIEALESRARTERTFLKEIDAEIMQHAEMVV